MRSFLLVLLLPVLAWGQVPHVMPVPHYPAVIGVQVMPVPHYPIVQSQPVYITNPVPQFYAPAVPVQYTVPVYYTYPSYYPSQMSYPSCPGGVCYPRR